MTDFNRSGLVVPSEFKPDPEFNPTKSPSQFPSSALNWSSTSTVIQRTLFCSTYELKKLSFCGTYLLTTIFVKCEPHRDDSHLAETSVDLIDDHLQKACLHSISSLILLIDEISVAISNAAFEYKNNLNELIAAVETFRALDKYSNLQEESEHNIIAARAKVTDCKKEYLHLITVIENVSKVASAVSELSFLIKSESSALSLFESLKMLRITINEIIRDIKEIENKCLLVEKNLIDDTAF